MCAPQVTFRRRAEAAYWLLAAALFAAQVAYTMAGLQRLWYEELAEGIRNPFWLNRRLVYDGASANIAWYAAVLLPNKMFGFSPYMAKYVRLALHLPFLVCAALLLRRWLGVAHAWLPLVALALSPTLLYFTTLGTSNGADLQLFPVAAWLIAVGAAPAPERSRQIVLDVAVGCVWILACLVYPSFVMYVPVLLAAYVWVNGRGGWLRLVQRLGWVAAGIITPCLAALAYLQNNRAFLADPSVSGTGVFRGGGGALTLDPVQLAQGVGDVLRDLFVRGESYYFALPHVEFSGAAGVIAAWGIFVGAVVIGWNQKRFRVPILLAGTLCALALTVPALSRHLPGLRRSTGFIAGAYVLLAAVWGAPPDRGLRSLAVSASKLACLLLVIHHVIVYVPNLQYLQAETRKMNDQWFYRYGPPDVSVATWTNDWVLRGRPLACAAGAPCRFSEIYAAVEGFLEWNGLDDAPVTVIDPGSGRVMQLDVELWRSGAIRH